jgi:hypothetical protein
LIGELLNEKCSTSVVVRRALFMYRLHFLENVYQALQCKSKEEKEDNLAAFFEIERMKLKEAACK